MVPPPGRSSHHHNVPAVQQQRKRLGVSRVATRQEDGRAAQADAHDGLGQVRLNVVTVPRQRVTYGVSAAHVSGYACVTACVIAVYSSDRFRNDGIPHVQLQ